MNTQIINRRKRSPTHPGALLREDILPTLGISQAALAEKIGVSRQTIAEVMAEKRSMSIDLAYRLGALFEMDATTFIRMQEAVDVWETLEANQKDYEKIKPLVTK